MYKCDNCKKTFSQNGNLKRHVLTHTGMKIHKCIYCDMIFFEAHLKKYLLIHTGEKNTNVRIVTRHFQRTHELIHSGVNMYK